MGRSCLVKMSQATDQLYEEYKEKRAERAQAAADRRSESPRAKFDLPLIDYDERHAETEPAAHLHQMAPVAQAEPVAHVKFEAEPQSEPVPVVPVIATSTSNQWTNKHIKEEHDAWEMRQWTRHIRDVHRASPLHYEEQEAEARRVASKGRERENARAPYGATPPSSPGCLQDRWHWNSPSRSRRDWRYQARSDRHLRPIRRDHRVQIRRDAPRVHATGCPW